MATAAERIAEQFPFLAFLARHPEIGPLLSKAVDVNQPYSAERFRAEVMKTKWWRNQSETQREWQILKNTQPGTAKWESEKVRSSLSQAAMAFGRPLDKNQLRWFTEHMMSLGITDPNHPMVLGWINSLPVAAHTLPKRWGVGKTGEAAHAVTNITRGQWYAKNSDALTYQTAQNIAQGTDSLEALNARKAVEAARRYPHFAQRIQAGETLADITANARSIIAEELELGSPEAVNVFAAEWRGLLGVKDPATKKTRQMTDSEVVHLARNRPQWWKTMNGRQADAQAATAMLETFGQRAVG